MKNVEMKAVASHFTKRGSSESLIKKFNSCDSLLNLFVHLLVLYKNDDHSRTIIVPRKLSSDSTKRYVKLTPCVNKRGILIRLVEVFDSNPLHLLFSVRKQLTELMRNEAISIFSTKIRTRKLYPMYVSRPSIEFGKHAFELTTRSYLNKKNMLMGTSISIGFAESRMKQCETNKYEL